MALPHRRQKVARFLKLNDVSQQKAAEAMGSSVTHVRNVIKGHTYPTPDELRMFSKLCNDMPYQVMFDEEMYSYVDAGQDSPPPGRRPKGSDTEAGE